MNLKNKIVNFFKNHKIFIINSLIPFIIFSVLFLAYYPGIITYDGNNQWQQIQSGIFDSGHPFFSTYFMLLLSKIHNTTSIIIFFQIFIYSLIWGIFCENIKTTKKGEIIKILCTTIISLTPIISIYSITLWKDILYSYYLFAVAILLFIGINKEFKYTKFELILFGILLSLIFSYRYNGILVVIMLIIIGLIYLLKNKNKIVKKDLKKTGIVILTLILFITAVSIPKKIIMDNPPVKEENKTENKVSLSTIDGYIVWMMGAHIKDDNIKDKKDLEFINDILEPEKWEKIYSPYLINDTGTCTELDRKYISENIGEFRSIFIKYTLQNPGTIIEHYLKANALLINPISQKYTYVYSFNFSEWSYPLGFEKIITSKIPVIKNLYNIIINLTFFSILKYFYQPALILYLSILMLVLLAKKVYDKKIYLFSLPMILNTVSLLPINLAQDLRYAYINYLTFFGILLLVIINYKKIFAKKEK